MSLYFVAGFTETFTAVSSQTIRKPVDGLPLNIGLKESKSTHIQSKLAPLIHGSIIIFTVKAHHSQSKVKTIKIFTIAFCISYLLAIFAKDVVEQFSQERFFENFNLFCIKSKCSSHKSD